jgi:oligopeptide transport system substrate-binding protein
MGDSFPVYDVLPPGLPNGGEGYIGSEPDIPTYNPTRARAYLRQCPGRLSGVTIAFWKRDPASTRAVAAVVADLAAIDVKARTLPVSDEQWPLAINHPGFAKLGLNLVAHRWSPDYPDAQDWLPLTLKSDGYRNFGGFSNAKFDRLVTQADIENAVRRRATEYREANRIALQQGAIIPLPIPEPIFAVSRRVHGIVDTPLGLQPIHGDWSQVTVLS